MKHYTLTNQTLNSSANLRAEDGYRIQDRQRALHSAIFAPVLLFTIIAILVLLLCHPAFGQAVGGRITGSVKDTTGAVIPGSNVTLTNIATGVTQSGTSNDGGAFNFPTVSIGQYELNVAANGFNSYRQTAGLKIDVNTALTIDVVMQVASTSQTVEVTENTAEVQTTDTQVGETIESKQVVDIPLNGRSYTDLLAVQAGVSPITTSGAGNTSSEGGFGSIPAAGEANRFASTLAISASIIAAAGYCDDPDLGSLWHRWNERR